MSDRKYKQRGYQDLPEPAGGQREKSAPRPAADRRESPRGRGLGAPTEDVFRCARCGEATALASATALDARCGKCGSDFHTCTHCVAFDTGAPFECRRAIPARVSPKDRANRCELFEPRVSREFAKEKERAPDARAAFDALFKR